MTERLRIALVGSGRMGRAIASLAAERDVSVVATITSSENAHGAALSRERLAGAHVVVEFTEPNAAVDNILAATAAGFPVVSGTTGWYSRLPAVADEVRRMDGALVYAPNFSVGVALFLAIAAAAGRIMRAAPEFAPHVVETHHAGKRDAPSGTADALARALEPGLGARPPIASVRTGYVPGTHELSFDGPFERIELAHLARDRRVFADGALRAAAWIRGHRGVFTMRDVLGLETGPQA